MLCVSGTGSAGHAARPSATRAAKCLLRQRFMALVKTKHRGVCNSGYHRQLETDYIQECVVVRSYSEHSNPLGVLWLRILICMQ